jgi:dolichol-phosphate mannosyltransferase
VLLGVRVRDLTGGFKCYRRRVLETIDLDAIHSKGYAFQIEGTFRTIRKGFRVVEVPIRFVDRTAGTSKMSRAIFLEAVTKVPSLRLAALTGRL